MNTVDLNEVKNFYNATPEIWAADDHWHQWSLRQIQGYIKGLMFSSQDSVLNAGAPIGSIVCVGSVINYCDAGTVIAEFSRLSKPGAVLVLEFESSGGFEYRKRACYKESATVVTVQFQGSAHTQWLYSVPDCKSFIIRCSKS